MIGKWQGKEYRIESNIFGGINGVPYKTWYSSSTGAIENPADVIESILREFTHAEFSVIADNTATGTTHTITNLSIDKDDYYNGAYLRNLSDAATPTFYAITDYDGSTKTLTLGSSATITSGDLLEIVNIKCNIDSTTFGAARTARTGWRVARQIMNQTTSKDLVNSLLYETHMVLINSQDKYKLIPIDTGTSVATFSSPLFGEDGSPLMKIEYTDSGLLFSDFEFNYNLDLAKQDYKNQILVNKSRSSDDTEFAAYIDKCKEAAGKYKTNAKKIIYFDWIYHHATAIESAKKFIDIHTQQRLKVLGIYSLTDYIKYEIGDLVKIDYDYMIPTSLNNAAIFMITGKEININSAFIKFTFTQII